MNERQIQRQANGHRLLTGEMVLGKPVSETTMEIRNADGLHMRPAMQFVDLASRFDCEVSVSNGQTAADGKSIMQMSMLAATCGTRLKVRAEGPDAEKAIEALRELVEVRLFGEPPP
ncbi:MAG TPA: HPr family phosphocarrier protein [Sedimentisphaerales bacterium]|nr:HPr family phosphocarrier protein [Sedimentisphaerales bacterium]